MKAWAIALFALLVHLAGAVMPGTARAHGIGWWGPGAFFGGLALGTALAYPYYGYPYYAAPYASPVPPVHEQGPTPSAPLVSGIRATQTPLR
jgi:hypothetical protein